MAAGATGAVDDAPLRAAALPFHSPGVVIERSSHPDPRVLELALALQLLATPAPAQPRAHVVPPLTLSAPSLQAREAAPPGVVLPARPVLVPVLVPAAPRAAAGPRAVTFGTVAGSSLGLVVGDVASSIPILYGLVECWGDLTSSTYTGGCAHGRGLVIAGAVMVALLPPATGILGARLAGERGDAGGSAYLVATLVRLCALGLSLALPANVAIGTVAATELLLTPYLIARVLASAPEEAAPAPAARALPVRDPAAIPAVLR